MKASTYRILIKGLVQGVGFRPFIYRLAREHGLKGCVENRNDGVVIKVNGSAEKTEQFREAIRENAPLASSIEDIAVMEIQREVFSSFEIEKSGDLSSRITEISPDIAVCDACLEDLDGQPHRIDYPLINCTHCGPRFTIIRDLPYDRGNTTMEPFHMCPRCEAEYNNMNDRRFHAEPVACNHCGPLYRLEAGGMVSEELSEILQWLKESIPGGGLLAIKGTGGFHLVCDAFSGEGVRKLRALKQRDGRPLALMFKNIQEARGYVTISQREDDLLTSWRRPIVLLERHREITAGIADGLSTLGIMLPYMPFHYLLFEKLETPALVMTSGNISEEPILISNESVEVKFSGHVDGIVSYNREIHNRVDDSVTAVVERRPVVIRRARGYVPSPIRTGLELEGILGCGAELTGSFCMGKEGNALMSQYTGDLKSLATYEFYMESYQRYCRLFRFTPQLVVSDLHPDYLSSRFARQLAGEHGIMHLEVQHHHAHIAAGMLSAGLEGEVIGFSFDGTGLGTDGHTWGAEVLRADYGGFERLCHFEYMPLPGGDKAVQEPWRMAVSYLYKFFGSDLHQLKIPLIGVIPEKERASIISLIEKGINTPLASSAGRLFDAVAAITGLNYRATYQAEAPMLLESAIDHTEQGSYRVEVEGGEVLFGPMIRQIVEDVAAGVSTGRIAARFHHALVNLMTELALEIRSTTGLDRVVLGGGCFQNRYLVKKVMRKLDNEQFRVYLPERIPVNDQGIAVGQLAIGAHHRNR
ncbi:MAG: carbamoyltransferase HypF [Bacteroidota bacterium]